MNINKGYEYRFRYRCKNINGWGVYSDVTYIKAAIVPSIPKAPKLIQATATTMALQFFKPEDTGGTEVKSFKLFINNGNDQNEPTIEVTSYSTNSLTHTLDLNGADSTILTSGKVYKFRFQATNVIGNSMLSDIAAFALADRPVAPGVPYIISSLTNANQIAVQWVGSADT